MEPTANAIFMEMIEQISNIHPTSILQRAESCYHIAEKAYFQLNQFVEQHPFKNNEEEINYFKNIQPKFLREQIYYAELYYLESLRPRKDKESIVQYFKEALIYNNLYFERNLMFYNYYRTERTHLDQTFFVKDPKSPYLHPGDIIEKHSYLFQPHSYKLARLQALEILNGYIQNEINALNNGQFQTNEESGRLTWTDSKVGLIELVYALESKGALNHGNADIQTVINTFQNVFQINLGNYSSAFHQNIRIRKKNRLAYLDQLRDYLERRMDEADENPRFI